MTTVELNYESDHEFFPIPSIYIDVDLPDKEVADLVAGTVLEALHWDMPEVLARRIAEELFRSANAPTLTVMRDSEPPLIAVNLVRRSVTIGETEITFASFIASSTNDTNLLARAIARG